MMALMTLIGCASGGTSGDAICQALSEPATEHAAALALDGGPVSVATGARLIRGLDAGCAR